MSAPRCRPSRQPLFQAAIQGFFPFATSQLDEGSSADDQWRDVLIVPIHGAGTVGVGCFAVQEVGLSDEQRISVHLIANSPRDGRVKALTEVIGDPSPVLTVRERQCLEFVAGGLSDGAISPKNSR